MIKFFLSFLFFSCILFSKLPSYLINYSKIFNVPIWYSSNFSFAESSHNPNKISVSNAYGRFQIKTNLFAHYCKIRGFDFNNIKNPKKFLLNDNNNSYIFCYMVAFWMQKGYTLKDIIQIWLFGETGFQNGRYSISFRDKIFKNQAYNKNNKKTSLINKSIKRLLIFYKNIW